MPPDLVAAADHVVLGRGRDVAGLPPAGCG
jgi:hypothetical protein